MQAIIQIAITFFLVANPIGNSPAILALVKNFDFGRQRQILLREGLFALFLALFFQYLGEHFLNILNVKGYAVTLCGGLLLQLVAIRMIFSLSKELDHTEVKQEPYFVPIATPLLSGPGLLTIIMLKSHLEPNPVHISAAILLAWVGVLTVLITAPYIQWLLGKRGMIALEQFMGLMLAMVSVQMLVTGTNLFLNQLPAVVPHE